MSEIKFEIKKRQLSKQASEQYGKQKQFQIKIPQQSSFQIIKIRQNLYELLQNQIKNMFRTRNRIHKQVQMKQKQIEDKFNIQQTIDQLRKIQDKKQMLEQLKKEGEKYHDLDEEAKLKLEQTISNEEREIIYQQQQETIQKQQQIVDQTKQLSDELGKTFQNLEQTMKKMPEQQSNSLQTILHDFKNLGIQNININDAIDSIEKNNREQIDIENQFNQKQVRYVSMVPRYDDSQFQNNLNFWLRDLLEKTQQSGLIQRLFFDDVIRYIKGEKPEIQIYENKNLQNLSGAINRDPYKLKTFIFNVQSGNLDKDIQLTQQILQSGIEKIKREINNPIQDKIENNDFIRLQKNIYQVIQSLTDMGIDISQNYVPVVFNHDEISANYQIEKIIEGQKQLKQRNNPQRQLYIRYLDVLYQVVLIIINQIQRLKDFSGFDDRRIKQIQEEQFQNDLQSAMDNQRELVSRQLQQQKIQQRENQQQHQGGDDNIQDQIFEQMEEYKGEGKKNYSYSNSDGMSQSEMERIINKTFLKQVPNDVITLLNNEQEIDTNVDTTDEFFICFLFQIQQDSWHWGAIYGSSHSLEWYEPYGEYFPDNIMNFMKEIKKSGFFDRKIKLNKVKQQFDDSDSCGYFVIWYLMQRIQGISYEKATYYKKINYREEQIEKLRNNFDNIGVEESGKQIQKQLQNI